jgi:peptidoglycan/LPS O-acetylase OafA/YrhL
MLAYLYRNSIPLNGKFCLFILLLIVIGAFLNGYNDTIFIFMLTYLVIYAAYTPSINVRWLTRHGDFSYGIYIWGWPIQQAVFSIYHNQMNGWLNLAIAGSIAVLLGAISWHLIEKRMLKLKRIPLNKFTIRQKIRIS